MVECVASMRPPEFTGGNHEKVAVLTVNESLLQ